MLCANGNIPIFGAGADGNASDKALLTRISQDMRKRGIGKDRFLYVADCAMVTKDNLALLDGNRFVTRLPFSCGEAGGVVTEAVTEDASLS